MTNFVAAIIIGVVIGGVGGVLLRRRSAAAIWQAPVLALVGALIGAGAGAIFGHHGYGWKKATLEIVLALVGVAVTAAMASRPANAPTTGEPSNQ